MQLDQKMLARLLQMDDAQLGEVIRKIAAESGVDPAELGLNPENIRSIRQVLGSASGEDVERMNRIYEEYRKRRRG